MLKLDYDDDILSKVQGFGKWQISLFALLWLPSAFSAMAVFMYSFIAYTPIHRCKIQECDILEGQYFAHFLNFTIPLRGSSFDACQHFE